MKEQFQRITEKDYKGTRGSGERFAVTIGGIIGDQTSYNNPAVLDILDILAFSLGGKKGNHSMESVGAFLKKQWTRVTSYLSSVLDNTTTYPDFLQTATHYETEYATLISDLTTAVADYDDDFERWKTEHSNLIDKFLTYTDRTLSTIDDVYSGIQFLDDELVY